MSKKNNRSRGSNNNNNASRGGNRSRGGRGRGNRGFNDSGSGGNGNGGNRSQAVLVDVLARAAIPPEILATMLTQASRVQALRMFIGGNPAAIRSLATTAAMMLGVTPGLAPQMSFALLELREKVDGSPWYTVPVGTGLAGGVQTATAPPKGLFAIIRRDQQLLYVSAMQAGGGPTRGFTWGAHDAATVSIAEIVNAWAPMERPIAYSDNNGLAHWTEPACYSIRSVLIAALRGDLASIAKAICMIRTRDVLAIPSAPISGNGVTQQAICAIISWVAAGAEIGQMGATGGQVVSLKWD
jgi:hypothetical protein